MSFDSNVINVEVKTLKKVRDLTRGKKENNLDISIQDQLGEVSHFKLNSKTKMLQLMVEV